MFKGISILALPCFLILSESPRWLASNDRAHEAEKVILKAAKWNGKKLNEKDKQTIKGKYNLRFVYTLQKKDANPK